MTSAESNVETVFDDVHGIAAPWQLFGDNIIDFGDKSRGRLIVEGEI